MAAAVPARFRSASASSGAGSDFVAHVRPRLEVSTRARQFFVPHDSVPRTQPLVVESNDTDVGLTRAELTFALAMSAVKPCGFAASSRITSTPPIATTTVRRTTSAMRSFTRSR